MIKIFNGGATIISLIQHLEADFLWNVSLKILKSGLILKTFTHVLKVCNCGKMSKIAQVSYFVHFCLNNILLVIRQVKYRGIMVQGLTVSNHHIISHLRTFLRVEQQRMTIACI